MLDDNFGNDWRTESKDEKEQLDEPLMPNYDIN
jgi:hypothetical protein